jgi:hypothetical protein
MNTTFSAPCEPQKMCTDDQLTWAQAAYHDLCHRASALEKLINSTHSWTVDIHDCAPDGDGAPTVLHVRVDRDAWFIATDAALAPRPALPGDSPPSVA